MLKYGQFCPVAKAVEVLGERWTLLIMREIVCGSRRYAELPRGLRRISPSVLSQRLKLLTEAGILEKKKVKGSIEYHPTLSGEELGPIVNLIGQWGQRWVRSKMTKDELDVDLLMIDMQRTIDVSQLPKGSVIQVEFLDQRAATRRWWLLAEGERLDLCTQHPGRDATIFITTRLVVMARVWVGDTPLDEALADASLELEAPRSLKKSPERWLKLGSLAGVEPAT